MTRQVSTVLQQECMIKRAKPGSAPKPGQPISLRTLGDYLNLSPATISLVLNNAPGVRSIPQDYLNVAKVLQLSPAKTFYKVLLPAALPYMFTGFRLSLGIAWLVIVAVEMLTGSPGIGGGSAGFSRNCVMRWSASTNMMPKRLPSALGTGMQPTVRSAPRSTCERIMPP